MIKYTLLYGIVLMLVALGGMFSEHSGIINIALEGIMVIGGVAGVLTLTLLPADMSPFLVVEKMVPMGLELASRATEMPLKPMHGRLVEFSGFHWDTLDR